MKGEAQMQSAASELRRTLSGLLEMRHADRIVLTPGILVGLRLLLAHLGVKRILLTSEEYYGPEHFPGATVEVAPCAAISQLVQEQPFDAVLASPASWRGMRQPVEELFGSIRSTLGERAPLLIADHAHAGSAGFPPIEKLGADVVCADLEKWILPADWHSRVAFLWFRTQGLFDRAGEVFRAFFLATHASDAPMQARWMDPDEVVAVSAKLAELGVTAAQLRLRHKADMTLARELAAQLELPEEPATSILWIEGDAPGGEALTYLEKLGLVWRLPGRGTRILCRSEALAAGPERTLDTGA